MEPLRIVLADNHLLFRKGLARLLDAQPDFEVVGEAQDGAEAVRLSRRMRPELILMDSRLPVCDGPEATRRIKRRMPEVRVVILGDPDDEELARAIHHGADGYLLKDILPEELFRHLRGLRSGTTPLSPRLAGTLFRQLAQMSRPAAVPRSSSPLLSRREVDVLRLIASGYSNVDIAADLGIARNTAKNHVRSILTKLGARNRAQAAVLGISQGLISGPQCDLPPSAADST